MANETKAKKEALKFLKDYNKCELEAALKCIGCKKNLDKAFDVALRVQAEEIITIILGIGVKSKRETEIKLKIIELIREYLGEEK